MQPRTDALLAEALALPPEELDELFAGIVGHLTDWDPEAEAAWIDEADRRWKRLQRGETDTIPWQDMRSDALKNIEDADRPL